MAKPPHTVEPTPPHVAEHHAEPHAADQAAAQAEAAHAAHASDDNRSPDDVTPAPARLYGMRFPGASPAYEPTPRSPSTIAPTDRPTIACSETAGAPSGSGIPAYCGAVVGFLLTAER